MNDNFGYIDIVLLAIVAGIIILRLRNVLGKGAEDSAIRAKKSVIVDAQFEDVKSSKVEENINTKEFKEDTFLKGAQAAYEMIVKTRFVSEIISCVKDANNNIIEGSSDEIQTVNDVWCFSKDLNSDDPTWLLTEIAQDVHGKE